jgi:hypothetical protein
MHDASMLPYRHIVAILTSGNVFAMDAVHQLNIKPKNWSDLLTGEKFNRKDILTIVDPMNPMARDMKNYKHMHDAFMAKKGKAQAKPEDVSNIRTSAATERIFKEISEKRKRKEEEQVNSMVACTHYTVLTILYSYCTHYTVLILHSLYCTHTALTILYSYFTHYTVLILYSLYCTHTHTVLIL